MKDLGEAFGGKLRVIAVSDVSVLNYELLRKTLSGRENFDDVYTSTFLVTKNQTPAVTTKKAIFNLDTTILVGDRRDIVVIGRSICRTSIKRRLGDALTVGFVFIRCQKRVCITLLLSREEILQHGVGHWVNC